MTVKDTPQIYKGDSHILLLHLGAGRRNCVCKASKRDDNDDASHCVSNGYRLMIIRPGIIAILTHIVGISHKQCQPVSMFGGAQHTHDAGGGDSDKVLLGELTRAYLGILETASCNPQTWMRYYRMQVTDDELEDKWCADNTDDRIQEVLTQHGSITRFLINGEGVSSVFQVHRIPKRTRYIVCINDKYIARRYEGICMFAYQKLVELQGAKQLGSLVSDLMDKYGNVITGEFLLTLANGGARGFKQTPMLSCKGDGYVYALETLDGTDIPKEWAERYASAPDMVGGLTIENATKLMAVMKPSKHVGQPAPKSAPQQISDGGSKRDMQEHPDNPQPKAGKKAYGQVGRVRYTPTGTIAERPWVEPDTNPGDVYRVNCKANLRGHRALVTSVNPMQNPHVRCQQYTGDACHVSQPESSSSAKSTPRLIHPSDPKALRRTRYNRSLSWVCSLIFLISAKPVSCYSAWNYTRYGDEARVGQNTDTQIKTRDDIHNISNDPSAGSSSDHIMRHEQVSVATSADHSLGRVYIRNDNHARTSHADHLVRDCYTRDRRQVSLRTGTTQAQSMPSDEPATTNARIQDDVHMKANTMMFCHGLALRGGRAWTDGWKSDNPHKARDDLSGYADANTDIMVVRGKLQIQQTATTIHDCLNPNCERVDFRVSNAIQKRRISELIIPNPQLVENEDAPTTFYSWQAFELGDGTNVHMDQVVSETVRDSNPQLSVDSHNNKAAIIETLRRIFSERTLVRKYINDGKKTMSVERPLYQWTQARIILAQRGKPFARSDSPPKIEPLGTDKGLRSKYIYDGTKLNREWRAEDEHLRITQDEIECSICAKSYKPKRDPTYLWHSPDVKGIKHCICAANYCVVATNMKLSSFDGISRSGEAKIKLLPMDYKLMGKVTIKLADNPTQAWYDVIYMSPEYVLATVTGPLLYRFKDTDGAYKIQPVDDHVYGYRVAIHNAVMSGSVYIPPINPQVVEDIDMGLHHLEVFTEFVDQLGPHTMSLEPNVDTMSKIKQGRPDEMERIDELQMAIIQVLLVHNPPFPTVRMRSSSCLTRVVFHKNHRTEVQVFQMLQMDKICHTRDWRAYIRGNRCDSTNPHPAVIFQLSGAIFRFVPDNRAWDYIFRIMGNVDYTEPAASLIARAHSRGMHIAMAFDIDDTNKLAKEIRRHRSYVKPEGNHYGIRSLYTRVPHRDHDIRHYNPQIEAPTVNYMITTENGPDGAKTNCVRYSTTADGNDILEYTHQNNPFAITSTILGPNRRYHGDETTECLTKRLHAEACARTSQRCIATTRTDLIAFGITNMAGTFLEGDLPGIADAHVDQYVGPLRIVGLAAEANLLLAGDKPQMIARAGAGLKAYLIAKCYSDAIMSRPLQYLGYSSNWSENATHAYALIKPHADTILQRESIANPIVTWTLLGAGQLLQMAESEHGILDGDHTHTQYDYATKPKKVFVDDLYLEPLDTDRTINDDFAEFAAILDQANKTRAAKGLPSVMRTMADTSIGVTIPGKPENYPPDQWYFKYDADRVNFVKIDGTEQVNRLFSNNPNKSFSAVILYPDPVTRTLRMVTVPIHAADLNCNYQHVKPYRMCEGHFAYAFGPKQPASIPLCGKNHCSKFTTLMHYIVSRNTEKQICPHFVLRNLVGTQTATDPNLLKVMGNGTLTRHCEPTCPHRHDITPADTITVEKIKSMLWDFNRGKVDRGPFAAGYQQWDTYRMGIASVGKLVSPSISRPCDMAYGRTTVNGVMGCPLPNCPMTLRANTTAPFDNLSWGDLAKCLSARDIRMPICELHAAKACPCANPDNDEPDSAVKKLVEEMAKSGDNRCPNPHGNYDEYADEALRFWKKANTKHAEAYNAAIMERDRLGMKSIYTNPDTIPDGFTFHDGSFVVPVYEASNFNAMRVADPFMPASFKPRSLAMSNFLADTVNGEFRKTAPNKHNPPHVERYRKAYYESARAKLTELYEKDNGGGLTPWQYQPELAQTVESGDAEHMKKTKPLRDELQMFLDNNGQRRPTDPPLGIHWHATRTRSRQCIMFSDELIRATDFQGPNPMNTTLTYRDYSGNRRRLRPSDHGWYPPFELLKTRTQDGLDKITNTVYHEIQEAENQGIDYSKPEGISQIIKEIAEILEVSRFAVAQIMQFLGCPAPKCVFNVAKNYDSGITDLLAKIDITPNKEDLDVKRFINTRLNAHGFKAQDMVRAGEPPYEQSINPDMIGSCSALVTDVNWAQITCLLATFELTPTTVFMRHRTRRDGFVAIRMATINNLVMSIQEAKDNTLFHGDPVNPHMLLEHSTVGSNSAWLWVRLKCTSDPSHSNSSALWYWHINPWRDVTQWWVIRWTIRAWMQIKPTPIEEDMLQVDSNLDWYRANTAAYNPCLILCGYSSGWHIHHRKNQHEPDNDGTRNNDDIASKQHGQVCIHMSHCVVTDYSTILIYMTLIALTKIRKRLCAPRVKLRSAAAKIGQRRYPTVRTCRRARQRRKRGFRNERRYLTMRLLLVLYISSCVIETRAFLGAPNVYGSEGPKWSRRQKNREASHTVFIQGNMNSGNTILPFLASTRAHVICNQELLYNPQQFWDAKRKLQQGQYRSGIKDNPWRAEGTPSNETDNGGLSAGAMIYTRPTHRVCPIPLPEGMEVPDHIKNPYDIIEGRLTGIILHEDTKHSIMVFSVYMECGDINSHTNAMIRYTLGLLTTSTKLPYIIMGDWQVNPEQLAEIGWLDTIDGYIIAPDEPTCKQEGRNTNGSIIDYAVVSNWVAPKVKYIKVLHDVAYNPHKYVEMALDFRCASIEELQAIKPKNFPDERPIGPCIEMDTLDHGTEDSVTLDEHACHVMDRIDANLINTYHLDHVRDAKGRSPYEGRRNGLVLHKVSDSHEYMPNPWDATANLESLRRVREQLVRTKEIVSRLPTTDKPDSEYCGRVLDKCIGAAQIGRSNPQYHERLFRWSEIVSQTHRIDIDHLTMLIGQYSIDIAAERQKLTNERANTYRDFITKAISHKGARVFHRILKKKVDVVARPVSKSKHMTTADQDHAEEQLEQWARVWQANPQTSKESHCTNETKSSRECWIAKVTDARVKDYRRILSTFKSSTAVAFDNLSPRAMQDLTDATLKELIALFDRCEYEKSWPQTWRDVIMVMIPKAEAYKWRLIAMLCTYYRIWAKRAGEDVSRWITSLNRKWIANGPGMSSEHAVYDIALDAEAHTHDVDDIEVTVMDDLEKGFEKVVHSNLRAKAEVLRFPPNKLPLALSMYAGRRRIRCGKAFSKPVSTNIGVLAGCPIAMGLLMLSVVEPVDMFWNNSPLSLVRLKVYVDDFALNFRFNKRVHTQDQITVQVANAYRKIEEAITQQGANFAKGKGKVVASDPVIAERIVDELNHVMVDQDQNPCSKQRDIVAENNITVLGVDYSAGNKVTHKKMKERLKASSLKATRINALAKGGWRKLNIMRAHVVSATAYSARVNGMPSEVLHKLRTMVRSATSTRAHGGSATMDMLLQKPKYADPFFDANLLPLMEWVTRVNVAYYREDMKAIKAHQDAWYNALANLYLLPEGTDPWKHISGPAMACILSLTRIQWKPATKDGWKVWVNMDGDEIDLTFYPPYSIRGWIRDDIERVLWGLSTMNTMEDKSGAWLKPLRAAILTSGDPKQGALTRSVAIGTQWTQERIAAAGYVEPDNNACQLCGEATGTLRHRHAKDGCTKMGEFRSQCVDAKTDTYIEHNNDDLFVEHGIMCRDALPRCRKLWGYDGKYEWYNKCNPKKFTANTYVDGSCVPCHPYPDLNRAGVGIICVDDVENNAENILSESPDNPYTPRCTCRNAGQYHFCTDYCKEYQGCNGECMKNKPKQKFIQPVTRQALALSLPGPIQTTPRAELWAILIAIEMGESPQTIISDHANHVNALLKMAEGNYEVLKPMTPNVDIWRHIKTAIKTRGGLQQNGPGKLWIEWQPAHTRASTCESDEQRNRRRGNDRADAVANYGRKLHESVENATTRTHYLYAVAKQYAIWCGTAAALQYDDSLVGCDHVIKPKRLYKTRTGKKQSPDLPSESRLLRKFPWGMKSLGTVEYTQDIHTDIVTNAHNPTRRRAAVLRQAANRTLEGARYTDRFLATGTGDTTLGKRLLTRYTPELYTPLSQEDAMGHRLYVTGLVPNQYIYCELCNAYSSVRAQNLVRQCQGNRYYSLAVSRLKQGRHPVTDNNLDSQPRRLTKKDVGTDLWWDGLVNDQPDVCCESALGSDSCVVASCRLEHAGPMNSVAHVSSTLST